MRMVIVGHVDHGKSTLIGRLLYDTDSIPEEKLAQALAISEKQGKGLEFAYILDALQEEQEQNITIDTTQIFFKTPKRDYVIIDAPGHKEFLKNMVSGASYAEVAILIVDVAEGVREQTQRHAYILSLLGVRQVVVCVNKMDSVGYKEAKFNSVKKKLTTFLDKLEIMPHAIIPISAAEGDNVAASSGKMSWYEGQNVLEALDSFMKTRELDDRPFRFPVQDVYKFDGKRIIAGRIESGKVKVGDVIHFSPSGGVSTVTSIEVHGKKPKKAAVPQCIGLTLKDPIFVDRGEVGSLEEEKPTSTKSFKTNIFWMGKNPLTVGKQYLLKLTTQEVFCTVSSISHRINSSTLEIIEKNPKKLLNTEVGEVVLNTKKSVAVDLFGIVPTLGRLVLVAEKRVCGGGIVTEIVFDKLQVKDLRGAECPFTLDHVKPIIDDIKPGQTKEILVTNFPAVETIGRLAFERGLEFSFKPEEDYIRLTVKSL